MTPYQKAEKKLQQIADFVFSASILHWDQEVNLPAKGKAQRARQQAALHGHVHNLRTQESLKAAIEDALEDNLSEIEQANMKLALEDFEKATKLPESFVVKLSHATSNAYHSWIEARRLNDFEVYSKSFKRYGGDATSKS